MPAPLRHGGEAATAGTAAGRAAALPERQCKQRPRNNLGATCASGYGQNAAASRKSAPAGPSGRRRRPRPDRRVELLDDFAAVGPPGGFRSSLNLPSSRVTANSTPTSPSASIAQGRVILPSLHGAASRASCRADSRSRRAQPFRVIDQPWRSIGVHRRVVPGRHRRCRLVPGRRNIGVRPGEDSERLGSRSQVGSTCGLGRARWPCSLICSPRRSTRNGIWLDSSRGAPCVTSNPNRAARYGRSAHRAVSR